MSTVPAPWLVVIGLAWITFWSVLLLGGMWWAQRHYRRAHRTLARRLLVVEEAARRRLAAELHDDMVPELGHVAMALHRLGPAATAAETRVTRLAERLRRLSHHLHPSGLEYLGFVEALHEAMPGWCGDAGVQWRVEVEGLTGPTGLPGSHELALYRLGQEAVRNAVRHAEASRITVHVRQAATRLTLEVADNGRGVPEPHRRGGGLGIPLMMERMAMLGGTCTVRRHPDGGTVVRAEVPLMVGARGGVA